MHHRGGRAVPLWDSGDFISEGGIVNLVNKDTEECRGFVARIRLELGVDLDYERRRDCREQTGLSLPGQRVFIVTSCKLTKIRVVSKSSPYLLRKSLSYSSANLR